MVTQDNEATTPPSKSEEVDIDALAQGFIKDFQDILGKYVQQGLDLHTVSKLLVSFQIDCAAAENQALIAQSMKTLGEKFKGEFERLARIASKESTPFN